MNIRILTNIDSQNAVHLILPIQQKEFNVPITIEDQPDLLDIDGNYNRPGGGFWGAMQNGQLIGTIGLINVGHNTGVIRKMFVKKEFRGKELGIAQRLIEALIAFSRAKGISDLYLGTINRMKAAQRFYQRNGFKQIRETDLPVYFPRMAADNTFYHLSISQ